MEAKRMDHAFETAAMSVLGPFRFEADEAPEILVTDLSLLQPPREELDHTALEQGDES